MQNQVKAVLKKMLVQSVRIDIDSNKIREKKETLTFAASGKSELRVPKEKDDNTFLLVSTVEIKSENEPDVFYGEISAEFYFEIDTMVKDYDNIVREQALPVVQEEVIKFTNKVLSGMGYEEFLHAQK